MFSLSTSQLSNEISFLVGNSRQALIERLIRREYVPFFGKGLGHLGKSSCSVGSHEWGAHVRAIYTNPIPFAMFWQI